MAKIGFIGLGIMGAHMARNLIKGGHSLFVNGAYPVPEDLEQDDHGGRELDGCCASRRHRHHHGAGHP